MKSLVPIFVEGRKLPWKVDLSAKVTGSRRVRQFLATEDEALRFIIAFREKGLAAAQMTIDGGFVSQDGAVQGATVSECWAMWLTKSAKLGASTRAQYRYIGKLFCAKFGNIPVAAVTHREVDLWLNGLELAGASQMHLFNCYRISSRFFEYCREWLEIIPRNPFAKIEREKPLSKKEILTPEEMKLALKTAAKINEPHLVAWIALGGFCGLRTSEALRMRWENFDWEGNELHVIPKKVRGGLRERYLELLPAAAAVLRPLAQKSGPVIPWNAKNFQLHRDKLLVALRKVDPVRWASWPDNALRHSAGTYHLAQFQDAGRTAQFMGHTNPQTTHKDYARAAKRVVAADWWGIGLKKAA